MSKDSMNINSTNTPRINPLNTNPLAKHFNIKDLLTFALPSVLVIVSMSIFGIIDGFFVANYVGTAAFAAVNLMIPVLIGFGAVGFMLGAGGSAIVAKTLGEGKAGLANTYFSLIIVYFTLFGVIISALGFLFTPEIAALLGSEGELLESCVVYGRILFAITPAFILQQAFLSFFSVVNKPNLSFQISLIAGLCNVVLDFVLIVVCELGILGAAVATAVAWLIAGMFPLVYFMRKSEIALRLDILQGLKAIKAHSVVLFRTCVNGSSEMVSQLSLSLVNILYNYQLMRLVGQDGIAAFGVVMYLNIIFCALFRGYSIASSQTISFQYGAGDKKELASLLQKSLTIMAVCGVGVFVFCQAFAKPLSYIFVSYDESLLELTVSACKIYGIAYIFMGLNIWTSAFFTALNNGVVSAIIAFLRTFVFQVLCVLILPLFLGVNGIFGAVIVAEFLSFLVILYYLATQRTKYGYV